MSATTNRCRDSPCAAECGSRSVRRVPVRVIECGCDWCGARGYLKKPGMDQKPPITPPSLATKLESDGRKSKPPWRRQGTPTSRISSLVTFRHFPQISAINKVHGTDIPDPAWAGKGAQSESRVLSRCRPRARPEAPTGRPVRCGRLASDLLWTSCQASCRAGPSRLRLCRFARLCRLNLCRKPVSGHLE